MRAYPAEPYANPPAAAPSEPQALAAKVAGALAVPKDESIAVPGSVCSRVRLQVLALHAALQKYHLTAHVYPRTLAELHLNDIAIDPLTGQTFYYLKQSPNSYTLSSGESIPPKIRT